MIDTHAHFTKKYPYTLSDVEKQLERAKEYEVNVVVSVMAEPQGYQCAYEAAQKLPGIYLVLGISRHLAVDATLYNCDCLISYLEKQNSKIVAIGETGLDYRFEPNADEIGKQRELFLGQIKLALDYDLPLVIHSGKAMDDVLEILEAEFRQGKGGIVHFFTGDLIQAKRAMELGFYLSFALPLLTDGKMQETCSKIPLQWILTETDSPFLKSPRGWPSKTSEPACVVEVVRKIAELKDISFEEAAKATLQNAAKILEFEPQLTLKQNPD